MSCELFDNMTTSAIARCWLCEGVISRCCWLCEACELEIKIRARRNAMISAESSPPSDVPESVLGKRRRDDDDDGRVAHSCKRQCIRPVAVLGERLPNEMERQYLETVHPSWISESWMDEVVDVQPCKVQDRYPFVVWDDKWMDSDDELPNAESVGHVSPVPIFWRPKSDQSSGSRSRSPIRSPSPSWSDILTQLDQQKSRSRSPSWSDILNQIDQQKSDHRWTDI